LLWLIVYVYHFLIIPYNRVLYEKSEGLLQVKKLPAIYGAWRANTAFAIIYHLSLSWARSIQPMSPPFQLLKIYKYEYYPPIHAPLSKWSPFLRYPNKKPELMNPVSHTWSRSSSLCGLLYFPVTSSLLGPFIFLSTLITNTLDPCSSLSLKG